jgi:RNA polymerase sigma-70 factor (ECF subfamily)
MSEIAAAVRSGCMTVEALVKVLLDARPRLVVFAACAGGDAHLAEDDFQEMFLRAMKMPESFPDAAGLLSWAKVTCRNLVIDRARREGRLEKILRESALDALDARLDQSFRNPSPRMSALQECLKELPIESRQLLQHRYVENERGADLARRFRRSEDAIYKSLSRLHQVLRQCVDRRLALEGS